MGDFALDLTRLTGQYKKRSDIVIRKIAFDIFSRIIMRTPVDTGRLRGNWQAGLNQRPSGQVATVDKGSVNQAGIGSGIAKGNAERETLRAKAGDVIWLTNNLPYAQRIEEEGWSPQAEEGMVAVVIAEFKGIVEKITRKVNK